MNATRAARLRGWWWLGIRCARLLVLLPVQLWRTWEGGRRLIAAYRRTVAPMTSARIDDLARRESLDMRLSGWALQGGYLIDSYARMIGERDVEDVAVVAASFTRLYDDLLEGDPSGSLGERIERLFAGRESEAASEIESLASDLFRWLTARVPAGHAAALYERLGELHHLQLEEVAVGSGRGRAEILRLTVEKGGAGMSILGGLVNPGVDAREFAVLHRLGAWLQLVDDFDDVFEDREVLTSSNWTQVSYGGLAAELHCLSQDLRTLYGRRARPFVDGLHNWLVLVGVRRVLDRVRQFDGELAKVPRRSLAMITLRKQHIR
jgi:hypothetical protein